MFLPFRDDLASRRCLSSGDLFKADMLYKLLSGLYLTASIVLGGMGSADDWVFEDDVTTKTPFSSPFLLFCIC